MQTTYSVAELSRYIRQMFETDRALQDLWIEGEISSIKRAEPSGHYYFSLKEGKTRLDCVMWRSSAQMQAVIPKDGDAVLAHGKVTTYEDRSSYQLYVDRIRPVGIGDLYYQFELLKTRLEAEGLFAEERKRPLPAYPHRIGVVTSASAAAFQDVQNVLRRRYPLVEVVLSPCLVQGIEAPAQIVRALERLNRRDDIDVILVCRGGGSIEDLWAFNDEGVARAIVASRVPVVSGVGHETDFTIADFAADVRAPTPSAAAELLTPDSEVLRTDLDRLRYNLYRGFRNYLQERRGPCELQARILKSNSPSVRIGHYIQRIDELEARMKLAQTSRLKNLHELFRALKRTLQTSSPQSFLERGYAQVSDPSTGKHLRSAKDVGARIVVRFFDGIVKATVDHD